MGFIRLGDNDEEVLEAAFNHGGLDAETAKAYPLNVKGFVKKRFLLKEGNKFLITPRGRSAWLQYRNTGRIWLAPRSH